MPLVNFEKGDCSRCKEKVDLAELAYCKFCWSHVCGKCSDRQGLLIQCKVCVLTGEANRSS